MSGSLKRILFLLCCVALGITVLGAAAVAGVLLGKSREPKPGIYRGDLLESVCGTTVDGQKVCSTDFQGKILIIDFWATWCPPCLEAVPELINIQNEYAEKGVQVIGISLDRSGDALAGYSTSKGMPYPSIFREGQELASYYNVTSIPTVLIVDRQGKIVFRGHQPDFREEVDELLAK